MHVSTLTTLSASLAGQPAAARVDGAPPQPKSDGRHPLGRWWLVPLARWLCGVLVPTPLRPTQVTLFGLFSATCAGTMVAWGAWPTAAATVGLLMYALCDRLDGLLARAQQTATASGGWIDAQVDEFVDLGLHAAVAHRLASEASATWPWALWAVFVAGKYLLMYGLWTEESAPANDRRRFSAGSATTGHSWVSRLYHLPANADVRIHLLLAAWLVGLPAVELTVVAIYYPLRALARIAWVPKRLGEVTG